MTLIDQPEHLPNIVKHIWLLLKESPGQGISEVSVEEIVGPKSLGDGSSHVRKCIGVGEMIGLFDRSQGEVSTIFTDPDDNFQSLLRRLIFDGSKHDFEANHGVGKLVRAISWYLHFDPWDNPLNRVSCPSDNSKIMSEMAQFFGTDQDQWPIGGPTRIPVFKAWAKYLGFMSSLPFGRDAKSLRTREFPTSFDPVAEHLSTALDVDVIHPCSSIVDSLVRTLPVLPGGTVSSLLPSSIQERSTKSSTVLGDALARLRALGEIEMLKKNDPQVPVVTFRRGDGYVLDCSHIRRIRDELG